MSRITATIIFIFAVAFATLGIYATGAGMADVGAYSGPVTILMGGVSAIIGVALGFVSAVEFLDPIGD